MSKSKRGKKIEDKYNIERSKRMVGEGNHFFGKKHTEETKQKISRANSGKSHKHTEEAKQKISRANKGTVFTDDHKLNISKAMMDKSTGPVSLETRKKMSVAQSGERHPMWGKKHTEETKRKISMSHKLPKRQLDEKDILELVQKYKTKKYTHKKLAVHYGVSEYIIGKILKCRKE